MCLLSCCWQATVGISLLRIRQVHVRIYLPNVIPWAPPCGAPAPADAVPASGIEDAAFGTVRWKAEGAEIDIPSVSSELRDQKAQPFTTVMLWGEAGIPS